MKRSGEFAKLLGQCNVFISKLWGLHEYLKLTLYLGFRKVEINVDSIMVVHSIDKRNLNMRESPTISQISEVDEKA